MASTPTGISGSETPTSYTHFGHHTGRRLRQFLRPDGTNIHIATDPDDSEKLHKQLTEVHPNNDFEVIIDGTPEHLSAIRELHEHHETNHARLREKHGDIYTEFEAVKNQLEALSSELHLLTEHGVSLDANFSKFGYSAHLRTKDPEHHSPHSSSTSGAETPGKRSFEDRSAEPLRLWNRPVIRQYFHKGLLWRSSKSGEVASFELFVDLLYVGVIGIIGDKAIETPTGKSFVEFAINFLIGWKIWSEVTNVVNWFEIDDIFQRICVLFYLCCLFGYATNIAYGFESTYTSMIAFYLTDRLFVAFYYIWVAYLVPTITGTLVAHASLVFVTTALWIGSIYVEYPNQLALIFIALFIDIFSNLPIIFLVRRLQNAKSEAASWLKKYFDFYPAVNIEHRTERNNAFVTLVFGYSVLTILFQNRAPMGMNAFFGKGILGLIQAFAFNWMFFEVDQYNIHVHAIRRHYISASIWMTAQIPFIMGYVLAAATLSKLVLAHDCSDTDEETLGETYILRSEEELAVGLRWFYCGGLGAALLSMTVISLSHIHKRVAQTRLRKRPRLVIRVCVAIIIICLPLAHDLSSLDLIAITTTLVVLSLGLDLFGNSCPGGRFWTGGFCEEQKKKCQYSANYHLDKKRRREVEKAMSAGVRVKLEDLLRRTTSVSSTADSELGLTEKDWGHGGNL